MGNDTCYSCKYHGSVKGLDTCAYSSGMYNRNRCERYERSWSNLIGLNLTVAVFVTMLIFGLFVFPILLILNLLGVVLL